MRIECGIQYYKCDAGPGFNQVLEVTFVTITSTELNRRLTRKACPKLVFVAAFLSPEEASAL